MTLKRSRLKSTLPSSATHSPLRRKGDKPVLPSRKRAEAEVAEAAAISASATAQPETGEVQRSAAERTMTSKRRLQRRVTPLEILQQPFRASVRKVFDLRRLLIVLALTAIVLLLPTPSGLSLEGHRAAGLFVFTGAILALEPAALPIAALMVPIAQIALGIDEAAGAFAPFGQPVLFLILGSLFLAEAMNKHGLIRRMALYTIVLSGGRLLALQFGLIWVSGLLSMWVLNTATVAVLIPVAITVAQRVNPADKAPRVLQLLLLTIAYSSSIGGMGTIMGSGENAIASGLLDQVSGFSFLDWALYGVPISLLLLFLTHYLLRWALPVPGVAIDTFPAARELARMGPLKAPEREIVWVLGISAFLWIAGASLESWFGLPTTLLSSAVIAIGAVAFLSIEEIVDWNDLKSVNWGVFFVIGAGLTLGDALSKAGTSAWFADQLAPWLQDLPYEWVLAMLVLIAFSLTQLINNVPLGAVLAPVLITIGEAIGVPPQSLVIPTIMALAPAYMLPNASARMTLVAVTNAVERGQMIRVGFLVGLPSAVVIYLFFYLLAMFGLI